MSATEASMRELVLRADKPPPHDINVEGIPEGLARLSRWICWKWSRAANGKWTKVPIQVSGRNASTTDQQTWADFSTVMAAAEQDGWGIGFVFNADGVVGIDLDDCRDPTTGDLETWAAQIVRDLRTYAEVSPSETGVKLFVRGELPEQFAKQHKRPQGFGHVEIYREGRFFTVTGHRSPGTPDDIQERTEQLTKLLATLETWKLRPTPTQSVNLSDHRETALAALATQDPGMSYHDWLKVGMSLQSVDASESMLSEWVAWSRGSDKFVDGECESKWRSFGGDGVTIATLCKMADDTGKTWRPASTRKADGDAYFDRLCEAELEQRPRIIIRTARELTTEFTKLRPPLIEGLLRSGEVMNIISAPKFGKSWLVLDLALSVASGTKWLGRYQTRPGKVLLIDNELHPETLASRIPRVAMCRELEPDAYADNISVVNLRGGLMDLRNLAFELMNLDHGAFDLCILDAWYRLQPSGTDENSNGDVTELYNLLEHVASKIGCAFSNVHHSSKGNQSSKSVTDVGSGAGAQARAPDTHLILRQHEHDGAVVVDAAVRSWPPIEPFCMRWDFPVWTIDGYLDPKDLRRENARGNAPDESESQLLEALQGYPDGATQTRLRDEVGFNGPKFKRLIGKLVKGGQVVCLPKEVTKNRSDMYKIQSGLDRT